MRNEIHTRFGDKEINAYTIATMQHLNEMKCMYKVIVHAFRGHDVAWRRCQCGI